MYAEYFCAFDFSVSNSSCVQLFAMNISSYDAQQQPDYSTMQLFDTHIHISSSGEVGATRITFEKKKNAPDAPPSVSLSLIVMEKKLSDR